MLLHQIIHVIQTLVRRLLRGTTRATESVTSPHLSAESNEGCITLTNLKEPPVQHEFDAPGVHDASTPSTGPHDAAVREPRAEPSVDNSGEYKSDGDDPKTASDSRDAADGAPVDQPMTTDDEPAESASVTLGDQSGQAPPDVEPVTPGSAGSEKTPFDPLEATSPETDLPPARVAEDHENAPNSNTAVGGSSQPDLTNPPPEPPKRADPPEDDAHNEKRFSRSKQKKQKAKAPRKIGGRRNGPTQAPSPVNDDARGKPTSTPRPELICRKSPCSWQREVVLFADDECNIVEVWHDGELLNRVNGEYRLPSLRGHLSIKYKYADREPEEFPLFVGTPLIFKLRHGWKGDGRKVSGITSGYFIVIAPRDWERTGSAPVEPEECTEADFRAHFYVKIGEAGDAGGFEGYDLALTTTGFELSGVSVFDNSEDGELFVGAPPELKPAPGIVWARIGEERKGGWKGENFRPTERSLAEVLNGRQGRFFVRVYDHQMHLADSGEFRYLRDLCKIYVNGEPYSEHTLLVPSSTGYPPAKVQFVSADGAAIQPNPDTDGTQVTVQPDGTVLSKPHPDGDHISCTLGSGEDRVDTVIKLPRIWWRVGRDDGEVDEWRDISLAMTRQQFREYSVADATIRLRLPLRVSSVRVGFDEKRDRTYRPQRNGDDTETEIPLSDFMDYSQIDQRLNEDALLNVQCDAEVMALICVSADPVPTITTFTSEPMVVKTGETATLHWAIQNAESDDVSVSIDDGVGVVESIGSMEITPTETTTFTLRLRASGMDDVTQGVLITVQTRPQAGEKPFASVKRAKRAGGGWRRGRGFSCGEIRSAGLTDAGPALESLPIDKRRRSTHSVNIDTIKGFIDV